MKNPASSANDAIASGSISDSFASLSPQAMFVAFAVVALAVAAVAAFLFTRFLERRK
ncbi:MAG TPA: hypothetical protein PKH33_02930 [bacterium]|nr:hypothetical protein [bacterium]